MSQVHQELRYIVQRQPIGHAWSRTLQRSFAVPFVSLPCGHRGHARAPEPTKKFDEQVVASQI